ncbi:oxygen-independent coproporphyrinogen III oxidase [Pedobacter sp. SYP-B3415]|uniref:oxygen-independent coproporphyrinogen III oxidase n=1 Tax=Pedobacter sp. SYP-B3415 TaxID=2496641 RepID=UPI00101C9644|nr:oxygen-independent coproporphyrinogen III oxidase [Pedobacter sp. SYP-B3415]
MKTLALLDKYNRPVPRYTSYPAMPFWKTDKFTKEQWYKNVSETYAADPEQPVSLYVHLPFCEKLCTYCACNTHITRNHQVERPYLEALTAEWNLYCSLLGKRPQITELHLGGGTPTFFAPENLASFLRTVLGPEPRAAREAFSFEGHPLNTSDEHLRILHSFGFSRFSIGIQDFDPRVEYLINRFQTPEQVQRLTLRARELGYTSVNFDLVYGLPGQTREGLKKTIGEIIAMRPDRIAFYSYAHVPWKKPGQRRYTSADLPDGAAKIALQLAGREMFLEAGYRDIGMDHFALPGDALLDHARLHRNFMGYTLQDNKILIGLGASAISETPTAFAQNEKAVAAYQDSLAAGTLPTEKGHLQDKQDLYLRRQIMELMCQGVTKLNNLQSASLAPAISDLEADGLVRFQDNVLEVQAAGRLFLRNICAVLDPYLHGAQQDTERFSKAV